MAKSNVYTLLLALYGLSFYYLKSPQMADVVLLLAVVYSCFNLYNDNKEKVVK